MKIRMLRAVGTGVVMILAGCTSQVQQSIDYYHEVAPEVRIGMSKQEVLSILEPAEDMLPADQRKPPESYTDSKGQLIDVYFFRSSYYNYYYGGIVTDDQFTPYIFTNGKLTAIGWSTLGGPRTEVVPVPYPYPYPYYPYYGPSHFSFGFGYYGHHHH